MRMKIAFAVIFFMCASVPISAQPVSCQQLINEAAAWDGKAVTIRGEVVGDILKKGGYEWLNVNDGTNALGVWTNIEDVRGIEIVPGDYSVTGTYLEIDGIFNRTCGLHSGETDIHLAKAVVVGVHSKVDHPIDRNKLAYVAILVALAAILTWAVAASRKSSKQQKA